MSAAVLSSSIHSDSIVDAVSLTMSVMVGMLMQGQSQAWRVQGVPAEEQEPGKAPGEKECLIRSVFALRLLANSCLMPQLRYFCTPFAARHVLLRAQH